MCGTCCTCAATFTFDGPRVLGSSCLATAADWTVTKLKTSNRIQEKTRALTDTPMDSFVHPQTYRCSPVGQVGHCGVEKPFLPNNTFARAHVLINENLQLPVCFNQTSLSCRRHEYHLTNIPWGLCRKLIKKEPESLTSLAMIPKDQRSWPQG